MKANRKVKETARLERVKAREEKWAKARAAKNRRD